MQITEETDALSAIVVATSFNPGFRRFDKLIFVMVKVIRNDGEIVIRDIPFMQWIALSVFVIFTGFTIYLLGGFYFSKADSSTFSVAMLILVPSLIWTVYSFLTTATTTAVINRQKQTITIQKKGLLKNDLQSYRFDEIADGGLTVRETYNEGKYTSIELPLKNGEKIDLTSPRSTFKFKNHDIVDQANEYLTDGSRAARKDDDFKLTIFNDE